MDRQRWGRIDEVFQAALDVAADQRAVYLKRVCAGDDDLRARVERLLELDQKQLSLIERPLSEIAADIVAVEPELRAGERLGDYEILELVGAGGMGEVYLARDARLGRKVALKLLPADFAANPERLGRFRTEARAASALNHPNIVTVYDVGSSDRRQFIATEFVDGETLRERMAVGRLEAQEALAVAMQIASALAVAHASGIVHRDVKPENVMVRRDGIVKVLDFGVAKLGEDGAEMVGQADERWSVRQTATQAGAIVGTAHYMSPEQARGEAVDARSDVFSFGVVLLELLTGEQAYRGTSAADRRRAIVHGETEGLDALGRALPEPVNRILRRCLEEDPAARYANGGELAAALEQAADVARSSGAGAARGGRRLRRRWSVALACAVLLAGGGAWWLFSRAAGPGGAGPGRASGAPAPEMTAVPLTGLAGRACYPSFSPDGAEVAFDWIDDPNGSGLGLPDVYVKRLDDGSPRQLTTSPNIDESAVWSPDGRYLAFTRESEKGLSIVEVPASGGPERTLQTLPRPSDYRIDWSPTGELIAYTSAGANGDGGGIYALTVATEQSRRLTAPSGEGVGDAQPALSPDGKTLAFVRSSSGFSADLYVVPVAGGEPTRLTFDEGAIDGLCWTPDGRSLVFASNRGGLFGLWRVPSTGGEPERVGVGNDGACHPAIARQGQRLAYMNRLTRTSTWRVDLSKGPGKAGPPIRVWTAPAEDDGLQVSPDGKRIAFGSTRSGTRELWVCDSDGANLRQLTALRYPGPFNRPCWSPDGRSIVFNMFVGNRSDIYAIDAGGGTPRRLTDGSGVYVNPSWSRDGQWIYFGSWSADGQMCKVAAEGGEPVKLKYGGDNPIESPDGKYLYFVGDGLWRLPVDGGEGEPVAPSLFHGGYAYMVADTGIYFTADKGRVTVLKRFAFGTGKVTTVARLGEGFIRGITVTRDGRKIFYSKVDLMSQTLMLVENFR